MVNGVRQGKWVVLQDLLAGTGPGNLKIMTELLQIISRKSMYTIIHSSPPLL